MRWLKGSDPIPRELAAALIRASAWWLTHSSGQPVRAPGHADKLLSSSRGWLVEFGANSFLVGLALERCRSVLNEYFEIASTGKLPLLSELKDALSLQLRGAVAKYDGVEYDGLYPSNAGRMIFGAQAIDLSDAVAFIIDEAQLGNLLA